MDLIISGKLIDYENEYGDVKLDVELDEETRSRIKVEFHSYFRKALLDAAIGKNLKVGELIKLNLIAIG